MILNTEMPCKTGKCFRKPHSFHALCFSSFHSFMHTYMCDLWLCSRKISVTRLQRSSLSIQMLTKEHSTSCSFSETLKPELCMKELFSGWPSWQLHSLVTWRMLLLDAEVTYWGQMPGLVPWPWAFREMFNSLRCSSGAVNKKGTQARRCNLYKHASILGSPHWPSV